METISTSDPEKLPESARGLLDESRALPPGVNFFEQRYTSALFLKRVVIGLLLFLIAAVLVLFSLEFLYERGVDPKYREYFNIKTFIAGAAFAYAGWMMVSSVGPGRVLIRRQAAGERTRHGIFLTPDSLVCQSQFDTTVIPRENFRGLTGGNVNYVRGVPANPGPKSFALPTMWVGLSPEEVAQAINLWSQSPPSPPLLPAL